MIQQTRLITVLLILLLAFPACRSRQAYANLAQAGTLYAAAIDNLLIAAANISIDTNSESLIADDGPQGNQIDLQEYQRITGVDKKRLEITAKLRQHVRLLSRYFGLLHELGTSDAPQRAQAAIGDADSGLIGNLNRVSRELRDANAVSVAGASVLGPITGAIADGLIRSALKGELNKRKEVIRQELHLQEKLLKFLSEQIKEDLTDAQQGREKRLIEKPITAPTPIPNPDKWVSDRRTVLTMKLTAEQLQVASDNMEKLREAFEDLVNGKLAFDKVNSLITDFEVLLSIAEKLKNQ